MQTQYSQCDQISNNIHKPGLFGTKALLGSVGGSTVREKPHFRDRGVPLSIPKEIAGSLFSQLSWGKKIHLYPGLEPHEQSMLEMEACPPKSTDGQIESHWSPVQEFWKVRTIITLWQLTKSRHGEFKVRVQSPTSKMANPSLEDHYPALPDLRVVTWHNARCSVL